MLIDDYDLDDDPALVRLAAIVHAADIAAELDTDPLGPGLLAIGLGGLDVEADDHRLLERASFVYDALYAWCANRSPSGRRHDRHLDYDDLRADTVRQVAKLMAAAAITAPKSGGQLFLAGKPTFMETVIVDDRRHPPRPRPNGCAPAAPNDARPSGSATPTSPKQSTPCSSSACPTGTHPTTTAAPAATPPAPSSSTPPRTLRETRPSSSSPDPPATCATSTSASPSARRPRPPPCTPSTAAARPVVAVAARKLGIIHADLAVALSLSLTHKAVGFDRRMPDVDFDTLDYPPTNTLPIAIDDPARPGGIRNRQQPRQALRPEGTD